MKLAWACPYYGPRNGLVMESQIANVMNAAAEGGHQWVSNYSTDGWQHRQACDQMAIKAAQDSKIDAVFWTEHDVVLPPDAVQRLATALEETKEADTVTGIVFRRCAPYSPMVNMIEPERLTRERYDQIRNDPSCQSYRAANAMTYEEMKENCLVSISHLDTAAPPYFVHTASMGCLMFRKGTLEKLVDLSDLFAVDQHGFFSIDNAFFLRHHKRGLKLYCVPSVLCDHIGEPERVSWKTWKSYTQAVVAKANAATTEKMRREEDETGRIYGELTALASKYETDKGISAHGYTDFYEMVLDSIRPTATRVLEIGVAEGESLKMWRDYFPKATIYGIDLTPKDLKQDRILTMVGDQANREQLEMLGFADGTMDLIVDDGGHTMEQQQVSLGYFFPKVKPGGVYVVEDLFTSSLGKEYGVDPDGKNATMHVVEALAKGTPFGSRYMTSQEIHYLRDRVESCQVYGRGMNVTCAIRKKRG